MPKMLVRLGAIFLAIGLLMAGLALYFYIDAQDFSERGVRTKGVIVGNDRIRDTDGVTYAPVVDWTDRNGQKRQFTSSTSSNPPEFARGETVPLLYDPEDPSVVVIDTFWQRFLFVVIFGFIGVTFALTGGGLVFAYMRRRAMIAQLKVSGTRLQAEFVRASLDRSIKSNGQSPYRVYAQAPNPRTGKLMSFKSEPIWVHLGRELEGATVPVLIDPQRPRRHYVDLSHWVDEDQRA